MTSETSFNLPLIDFSSTDLKPGCSLWETVKSQVRKAAEDYGCFEAVPAGNFPGELRKSMGGALEEIFALPLEKKKLHVSDIPFHGWVAPSSALPYHEAIGFADPDNPDNVASFSDVLWPHENINFREAVHCFSKKLTQLQQMIRMMILESFGSEKDMDEHAKSTYNYLKLTKYEAPKSVEKTTGFSAHRDGTMTSILYQHQDDGLEVQAKDSDKWFAVKFSPGSVLVLIGEPLSAWTRGRLHAPNHRVMISGKKTRYSAILFTIPKEDSKSKAAEEEN